MTGQQKLRLFKKRRYKRHFKNLSYKSCGSSLKNESIKESVTRCFHVYYVLVTLG